jgi:excisionase family DNA binding protein
VSGDRDRPLRTLPTVLNVGELCQALRVSDDTVRALVAAGRLRRLTYSSHSILVARDEVWRFLRENTLTPPADPPAEPQADRDGGLERPAPHRKGTRWPLDAQGGAIDDSHAPDESWRA